MTDIERQRLRDKDTGRKDGREIKTERWDERETERRRQSEAE